MKKRIAIVLALVLLIATLAGCAGTPVIYYTECECSQNTTADTTVSAGTTEENGTSAAAGALKTGLAVIANVSDSKDAESAAYDITLAAVLVDDNGIIRDCIIDSIGTSVTFDATGAITSDLTAEILTKNELGDDYGMKAYGGAKYEWYEQAAALADFAVGKNVEKLKAGAIDETGSAPDGSDLSSTATIYLGGYVAAVEEAVNNAKHLGAQVGDELKLASLSSLGSSKSASAEGDGLAQLDCDVTALTVKDGVITSCALDSVQAKVSFAADGKITSDLTAPVLTKNQLGADYGMVAYAGAIAEWDAQAASFARYVTGKTADEVAGIAVSEGKPTDTDLTASVTISITGFQNLIGKAVQ